MMTATPTEHFTSLKAFAAQGRSNAVPTYGGKLLHAYLNLDVPERYRFATNQADAYGFLRNLQRAAAVAGIAADAVGGFLLELQGPMIHLVVPEESATASDPAAFAARLHRLMETESKVDSSIITGWRMACDFGQTLVVHAKNLQVDRSFISLGNAANRPAKHLYAQLAIPHDDDRLLKKFHLGVRQSNGSWTHTDLRTLDLPQDLMLSQRVEKATSDLGNIEFLTLSARKPEYQMAVDLVTPDGQPAPGVEQPARFHATVVRADLDGFTARVSDCKDDELELEALGKEFVHILHEAREFLDREDLPPMVQLPWSGDNCTFAIADNCKESYDARRETETIDTVLGFKRNLDEAVREAQLEGWAFGVAGGDVHGNASGNFFVGRIPIQALNFLVAAGEGVGRSLDAFAKVAPKLDEVVLLKVDKPHLAPHLRDEFSASTLAVGGSSTRYQSASVDALSDAGVEKEADETHAEVRDHLVGTRSVPVRPHLTWPRRP